MINLNSFLIDLDRFDINMISHNINRGLANYIERLLHDLDCTRVYDYGRPNQTINFQYKHTISIINYIVTKCPKGFKGSESLIGIWDKIEAIHKANLEFEKINPVVYYSKVNKTSNKKSSKVVSNKENKELDAKVKKITKAEQKIINNGIKISKMKFNLKEQ